MQRIDKREQRQREQRQREQRQREQSENANEYGFEVDTPRQARKEDLVLNQYEQTIASEVIAPEDIALKFDGRSELQYLKSQD